MTERRRIKVTGYLHPEEDERDDNNTTGLTEEAHEWLTSTLGDILEDIKFEPKDAS